MKSFKYHWAENIKPLICFFFAGVFVVAGLRVADWAIPARPAEYRICIQEAGGDYMCEVYK